MIKLTRPSVSRSNKLQQLLPELGLPAAMADIAVSGVTIDSRQVEPGDVFVALVGERLDARQFIAKACAAGAAAVLVESTTEMRAGTVNQDHPAPVIAVANLAERLSALASQCYGEPSKKLSLVGVTGTNGKSTCVSLIAQLYQAVEGKAATLGTLGAQVGDEVFDFGMTTPDAASCQKILAFMAEQEVELVAMEVSSHGLAQERVAGIEFDTAVFTNLSHDHLDYHKSIARYAAAKQKLFEWPQLKHAVINLDDPYAAQMLAAGKQRAKVYSYSILHFVADVYASDIQYDAAGVHFRLHSPWGAADINSPLLGVFNVSNLLAAMTSLLVAGADFTKIVAAVEGLRSVPGRMQGLSEDSDISVVVDYAHTPDALEQAISAVRMHVVGKLWVVFGCGGDRDRTKRPLMAAIAEQFSDHVVVTSDNPRGEAVSRIFSDVYKGFKNQDHRKFEQREEAINYAIEQAESGDVILLAGKGHEAYQIVGDQKLPFSDIELGLAALAQRNKKRACEGRT